VCFDALGAGIVLCGLGSDSDPSLSIKRVVYLSCSYSSLLECPSLEPVGDQLNEGSYICFSYQKLDVCSSMYSS
jgi:hypothetical protein